MANGPYRFLISQRRTQWNLLSCSVLCFCLQTPTVLPRKFLWPIILFFNTPQGVCDQPATVRIRDGARLLLNREKRPLTMINTIPVKVRLSGRSEKTTTPIRRANGKNQCSTQAKQDQDFTDRKRPRDRFHKHILQRKAGHGDYHKYTSTYIIHFLSLVSFKRFLNYESINKKQVSGRLRGGTKLSTPFVGCYLQHPAFKVCQVTLVPNLQVSLGSDFGQGR